MALAPLLLADRCEELEISGWGPASSYAESVLHSLGARVRRIRAAPEPHPAQTWALSGAMELTGMPQQPPRPAPAAVAAAAQGALSAFRALANAELPEIEGPALLGERAAVFQLKRRGRCSPGGSCRLLHSADGWLAVNLARPADRRLLPAWLGEDDFTAPWGPVAERIARQPSEALLERARLIGLPVAPAIAPRKTPPPWWRLRGTGPTRQRAAEHPPLVVDLSSLWAGPLCTHLLERVGAHAIKLESLSRPDGARSGPPAFFDLINAHKRSAALDLSAPDGRRALERLLRRADIVVESARPRALEQLGISAERIVSEAPGLTWISITGYGRDEPERNWVAFGDDAGAAAGLCAAAALEGGDPLFCADAVADPLTGMHAALAALASWRAGGGHLLDISLCGVAGHALGIPVPELDAEVRPVGAGWELVSKAGRCSVLRPRARPAPARAARLGEHTTEVLAEC